MLISSFGILSTNIAIKKRIYSCFIDLSKAFDTVPRDILLKKLHSVGVKGNVFNIIRSIYTNDSAYMKIDEKLLQQSPKPRSQTRLRP